MTRGPTVLVVDDDRVRRVLTAQMLTNGGLRVETFASAHELLECADLSPPAVLLLELSMPDMAGFELQKLLSERESRLPIVILADASTVAIAVAAMKNGAADFIEKPLIADALVERVRACMAPLNDHASKGLELDWPMAHDEHAERLQALTPREREVHDCMITGRTSKEIARDLGCSFRTVEIHRSRVMDKMAMTSLANLVRASVYSFLETPRFEK